jgi:hypothetical protein
MQCEVSNSIIDDWLWPVRLYESKESQNDQLAAHIRGMVLYHCGVRMNTMGSLQIARRYSGVTATID